MNDNGNILMSRNDDNCFTLFRYLFAFSIFYHHLCRVTGGEGLGRYAHVFVLGFFIISGYLTLNSYARYSDWRSFVVKRVKRIMPAYVLTILFCFCIGALFTTLPLWQFLKDPHTWKYLFSNLVFLNFLQPTLPGVFVDHYYPMLNAALWTMKIEVLFYFTVPLVWMLMKRFGTQFVLWTIVVSSLAYGIITQELYLSTDNHIFYTLNHQFIGEMCAFYFPVLVLINWEWFMRRYRVWVILAGIPFLLYFFYERWAYVLPIALSLLVILPSYALERWVRANHWQNITYEFFLLHFPILNIGVELMPGIERWQLAIIAFPATCLLAYGLQKLVKFIQ